MYVHVLIRASYEAISGGSDGGSGGGGGSARKENYTAAVHLAGVAELWMEAYS